MNLLSWKMEKLLNILSDLQVTPEYISTEISEIDSLSTEVSESTKAYQQNCDDFEGKIKAIEDLKQEEQLLFAKIKDSEEELVAIKEKLEDLHSEYKSITDNDKNFAGNVEVLKNLEYKFKLFGLDIQAQYLEPTVYQAKISFAENKFVIFNCDIIENAYDLQVIEPNHRQFDKMRRLLLESKDILGLLCQARKYFAKT